MSIKEGAASKSTEAAKPVNPDSTVITIDEEGIADRIESLPVTPGNYVNLTAHQDGLFYATGSSRTSPSLKFYSIKEKKENDLGVFAQLKISDNKKESIVEERN